MRRAAGGVAAVLIAVAGVVGLIAFFNSRDSSTTGGRSSTAPAPGVSAPAGGSALIRAGNVVLTYSDPHFTAPLRGLAARLGAPDTPALRAAGQAVVLRINPRTGGVTARALRHSLTVRDPTDPALQDFIERWLGPPAS